MSTYQALVFAVAFATLVVLILKEKQKEQVVHPCPGASCSYIIVPPTAAGCTTGMLAHPGSYYMKPYANIIHYSYSSYKFHIESFKILKKG